MARVKKEYEEKQRKKKEKEKEAEKKGDKDKEKDGKSDNDKKKKDEKSETEVSDVRDPGATVYLLTLSLRKPRTVHHQKRKRSRGCLS